MRPSAPTCSTSPAPPPAPLHPGRRAARPRSKSGRACGACWTPAYVRNARLDVLAANRLGAALFAPVLSSPAQPANNARFLFLDPAGREFFSDWGRQAQDVVAMLRTEAGRSPYDKGLSNLIGELSTRSEDFRT
jgi:hypothetical protein